LPRSWPDPRDRLEPAGRLVVEKPRDPPVGFLDLAFEQVVLVEQEADLEGDLGLELGHGDRLGRGDLQPLGPRRPQPTATRSGIGVGQRGRPSAGGSPGRRGDPEHLAGRPAGRVVEELTELREAELDEADEPLADPRLLGHEGHRKAGGLTELGSGERIANGRGVAHGHLGKAPGIGRIGLRAGEPALGKVARRERVDHRDRDLPAAQVGGERHPVVAGRLHRDEGHRLGLALEPGVEGGEAGPVLADPEDLAICPSLTVPQRATTCVRPPMSIPIVVIRAAPFRGPQGCPLSPADVS
jgi:hypothetical protein